MTSNHRADWSGPIANTFGGSDSGSKSTTEIAFSTA